MNGFVVANSIALAMEHFPDNAGTISALLGAFQYGGGIITSGLVGMFANGTPFPMCIIMAVCGLGVLLSALVLKRYCAQDNNERERK